MHVTYISKQMIREIIVYALISALKYSEAHNLRNCLTVVCASLKVIGWVSRSQFVIPFDLKDFKMFLKVFNQRTLPSLPTKQAFTLSL